MTAPRRDTGWFKSTRSGSGDEFCVEVRITDSTVGVRDSKNQTGPSFIVPTSAWTHFIDTAKAAQLNF